MVDFLFDSQSVDGIEASSSHALTILPSGLCVEIETLGWAMVGQSSGQSGVGMKIWFTSEEMVVEGKNSYDMYIYVLHTVYCTQYSYKISTLENCSVMIFPGGRYAICQLCGIAPTRRSRCTLIWTTTNDPFFGQPCGKPRGEIMRRSAMAAGVSRALSAEYIYTYIYIDRLS